MTVLVDALRLSVGTFTAIPVPPPHQVTARTVGLSVLFAPMAVLPLGLLLAAVVWAGRETGLPPLAVATVGIAAVVLGNRAFHLDGLADTVDGLSASYDRERSLQILKTGDVGPAGVAALVLVLVLQISALASVLTASWGPVAAGIAVCVSRGTTQLGCLRGIKPARREGLGSTYAQTVEPRWATASWVLLTALVCLSFSALQQPWWHGLLAAAMVLAVIAWLLRRAHRRFGGIVGDVLGAGVEVSFALLLLVLNVS